MIKCDMGEGFKTEVFSSYLHFERPLTIYKFHLDYNVPAARQPLDNDEIMMKMRNFQEAQNQNDGVVPHRGKLCSIQYSRIFPCDILFFVIIEDVEIVLCTLLQSGGKLFQIVK